MLESRKIIAYVAIRNNLNWEKTMQDIKEKNIPNEEVVEEYFEVAKDNFITLLDKEYPIALKNCSKPPFIFYYEGDKNILSNLKNKVFISNLNGEIQVPFEDTIWVGKDKTKWKVFIGNDVALWFGGSRLDAIRFAMVLADKVVITETSKNNESIIAQAVCYALYMGKDIYCTPGEKGSLNNRFIQAGAILVETAEDLW